MAGMARGVVLQGMQYMSLITINLNVDSQLLEKIMATLKDVQDALDQAAKDATAEKAEVATAIADLNTQIQALKDQIANGSAVTAADLDGLVTKIQGIDAQVKDITVPAQP